MSQRYEPSGPANLSRATRWLIHHSAHRAPESLSSRLEEEWLADVASRSSELSKLRFAAGCYWASLVIGNESARIPVPAASSALAAGGIVTLTERNFGYFSLRSATLFLIAGLHGALFYGMITTLSHTRATTPQSDLENHALKEVPPERVPVLQPLSRDWTIAVPKPDAEIQPLLIPSDNVTSAIEENSIEPDSPPAVIPPHVIARIAGGPGAGFPDTADFYPSPSIRMGEQGISTVQVCVDSHGRLTADPTIVRGSGSARLDQGALKLARAASGHYRASTEDGQPVDSCYPLGIRFQLSNLR